MNRLLAEYPPEPYVAATMYALAQRVYAKAPKAAADPKLREKKVNRVMLVQQALAMLDHFLTLYPEDPAADQAAFSLANALLELKAYKEVIERANRYAKRYKDSEYLDSYWYIAGLRPLCPGRARAGAGDGQEGRRAQTDRQADRPRGRKPQQVAGDLHHGPGVPQPRQGGRRDRRVPEGGGPLPGRQGSDRVLHAQGDFAARGDDDQARRGGGGGAEVPQRRRAPK